jgi:hypothetical protein
MNASWTGDSIKANADVTWASQWPSPTRSSSASCRKHDGARRHCRARGISDARNSKLQPADITGATFVNSGCITSTFTAIIVPPQASILAVGAMTDPEVPVPAASACVRE